jgi:hypothetical protein
VLRLLLLHRRRRRRRRNYNRNKMSFIQSEQSVSSSSRALSRYTRKLVYLYLQAKQQQQRDTLNGIPSKSFSLFVRRYFTRGQISAKFKSTSAERRKCITSQKLLTLSDDERVNKFKFTPDDAITRESREFFSRRPAL